ncbi:MAG: 4Fe-4S cluster-binding domain-containing protein [Planctomycetota bacterium]|nr:4Fe-4S cluster-binding domain-containing protein [Planctomycetota bacterium]
MTEIGKCSGNMPLSSDIEEKTSDVVENPATAFVHRFETRENKYIYDVNTMKIVRVTPVVWEIIGDFGILGKEEIFSKYRGQFSMAEISSACDEIAIAQRDKNLFLSNRPQVELTMTEDDIRQKLNNKRKILILLVTEDCNFRCCYCVYSGQYAGRHALSRRKMKWSIAKKGIDCYMQQSGSAKIRSIGFYGGEPLLNLPLIKKCVGYVKKSDRGKDIIFSITVNGSLLTGDAADFLASENFSIVVSIDGPREIHDRYRRYKNGLPTWQKVTSNIRAFLDKYPQYRTNDKLSFNMVMAPPLDIDILDKFLVSCDLFDRHIGVKAAFVDQVGSKISPTGKITGFDLLYKRFINNLAAGRINSDVSATAYRLQREMNEQDWLFFHKRFQIYQCHIHNHTILPERFCSLSTCVPGTQRTYLSIDGDYWPCERVPESEYMKIGDVENGLDIAKIKQLLSDWVDFTKDQCRYCWCLHTCKLGCWSNISDGEKPTGLLKKTACQGHRFRAHKLLVDYCTVLEKNPHALDYMENIMLS